MNKQLIRKRQLTTRQSISDSDLIKQSDKICKQVLSLIQQQGAKCVHLFLPILSKKEVDTRPIYDFLIKSNAHIPVISKTDWANRQLTHHPMEVSDKLTVSKLGIPEPSHDSTIDLGNIEHILVPLLAFDTSGNRLGYGAGLYDRFLAQCPHALKVGLSLLPMVDESLPTDEHDVPLDMCITPNQLHDFRS